MPTPAKHNYKITGITHRKRALTNGRQDRLH